MLYGRRSLTTIDDVVEDKKGGSGTDWLEKIGRAVHGDNSDHQTHQQGHLVPQLEPARDARRQPQVKGRSKENQRGDSEALQ